MGLLEFPLLVIVVLGMLVLKNAADGTPIPDIIQSVIDNVTSGGVEGNTEAVQHVAEQQEQYDELTQDISWVQKIWFGFLNAIQTAFGTPIG